MFLGGHLHTTALIATCFAREPSFKQKICWPDQRPRSAVCVLVNPREHPVCGTCCYYSSQSLGKLCNTAYIWSIFAKLTCPHDALADDQTDMPSPACSSSAQCRQALPGNIVRVPTEEGGEIRALSTAIGCIIRVEAQMCLSVQSKQMLVPFNGPCTGGNCDH